MYVQESICYMVNSYNWQRLPKLGKKRPIRRATARDKEFPELVHKVHLLCLIGRGMLINSASYDPLIQASLYSIVPPHLLDLAK